MSKQLQNLASQKQTALFLFAIPPSVYQYASKILYDIIIIPTQGEGELACASFKWKNVLKLNSS